MSDYGKTPEIDEKKSVIDVYDTIGKHFSITRGYVWPGMKRFYKQIEDNKDALIADIGCGNGRNMVSGFKFIGVDLSETQCKIAKEKTGNEIICGSVTNIPLDDNSCDYAICIAVIHHLSKYKDRMKAIKELIRILKKDGIVMITVWEYNKDDKKRNKKHKMIPWILQKKYGNFGRDITVDRYYYLFDPDEMEEMVKKIDNVKIVSLEHECGNTYIQLKNINLFIYR